MKLKEDKIKSEKIFSGKAIGFNVDTVRIPNGKKAAREYMVHPGAVAVLPVLKNGKIIFVKQYRYPVREITYEIPAGKLNGKKDDFLKRAKAELKEETGYSAKKIKFMISFWPTPAFSNELLKIYLATDLEAGRPNPDEDEFLNVIELSMAKTLKMIKSGKIKDSKTIIAVQTYLLENRQDTAGKDKPKKYQTGKKAEKKSKSKKYYNGGIKY